MRRRENGNSDDSRLVSSRRPGTVSASDVSSLSSDSPDATSSTSSASVDAFTTSSDSAFSEESGNASDDLSETNSVLRSSHSRRHSSDYPAFQFLASEKSREQRTSPNLLRDGRRRHRNMNFLKRMRRVGMASIPFAVFLLGLSLLSVGFFSYVENESVLAIFLTGRDAVRVSTSDEPNVTQTSATTVRESATIPTETEGKLVVPFYYQGDQIGTIRIASAEIEVGVYQGDTEDQFRLGAGHYFDSFLPGQEGNIVIASHRTSYFRDLEYVEVGDIIDFETTYGSFTYVIREISILEKKDFDTITDPTDQEQLTLYTCYPFVYVGNAPNRYVVRCDLTEAKLNT